jgi:MFS family permease
MFYGWRVVGGAFTAQMFVVGFFTYAISVLVAPVRAEFGVSLEQVMYSPTVATFIGLLLQPVAGALVDRLPVRWLMSGGALIYGLGLYALSRCESITQYIVLFGFTMAAATAFVGPLCSSAVISRWFTASRGRALGIAAIGTSVGGVVIPALLNGWIAQFGWRGALENMALLILLLMWPIVVISIRGKPADVGMSPEPSPALVADTALPDAAELSMRDIAGNPRFWYIGLSLGLLFSVYTAILANLTPYATNLGRSAEQASTLIMSVAVAGFAGKLLFGYAADRISLRTGLWAAQALVMAGFLILALEPAYGVMLLATALVGLAAGGMLPVWGAIMAQAFGLASYGRAMGLMGPLITVCVMPSFAVVGRLFDISGSYSLSLYISAGLAVVAAALLLPLRLEQPPVAR